MPTEIEEEFDAIIQEAIDDAEKVDCALPEFYKGLKVMRDALDKRIAIEREEV